MDPLLTDLGFPWLTRSPSPSSHPSAWWYGTGQNFSLPDPRSEEIDMINLERGNAQVEFLKYLFIGGSSKKWTWILPRFCTFLLVESCWQTILCPDQFSLRE